MLSTWDVKYSFNNIYAISSSSHSLIIWVLHTLRVHSHIANIPGYFKNISGVTLIPKEPKRHSRPSSVRPLFPNALPSPPFQNQFDIGPQKCLRLPCNSRD